MNLPDVAFEKRERSINFVGMGNIQLPLTFQGHTLAANVKAQVSLDKSESRGIHMSRLYLALQEKLALKPLSQEIITEVLQDFLKTHETLSSKAHLEVSFQLPLQRKALKSEFLGWRLYQVSLKAELEQGQKKPVIQLSAEIVYSSTCPASAALSRHLIAEKAKANFANLNTAEKLSDYLSSTDGVIATPHAQRSKANISWEIASDFNLVQTANFAASGDPKAALNAADFGELNFAEVIEASEIALQTPVQTAVKRVDEQEFALRNGQNLMFCEDAVRKLGNGLDQVAAVKGYWITVSHEESLHPHDAVATLQSNWRSL